MPALAAGYIQLISMSRLHRATSRTRSWPWHYLRRGQSRPICAMVRYGSDTLSIVTASLTLVMTGLMQHMAWPLCMSKRRARRARLEAWNGPRARWARVRRGVSKDPAQCPQTARLYLCLLRDIWGVAELDAKVSERCSRAWCNPVRRPSYPQIRLRRLMAEKRGFRSRAADDPERTSRLLVHRSSPYRSIGGSQSPQRSETGNPKVVTAASPS